MVEYSIQHDYSIALQSGDFKYLLSTAMSISQNYIFIGEKTLEQELLINTTIVGEFEPDIPVLPGLRSHFKLASDAFTDALENDPIKMVPSPKLICEKARKFHISKKSAFNLIADANLTKLNFIDFIAGSSNVWHDQNNYQSFSTELHQTEFLRFPTILHIYYTV